MSRISWIGLGRMGLPMATHLVAAGHAVKGFDLSPDSMAQAESLGISPADSLADAVAEAEFVFTMLPQGADVIGVYSGADGILANAPAKAILVDSSTISIASCTELHQLTAAAGFNFVDAPVSGGTMGAEAGTLTFMVGGPEELFAKVSEPIALMSANIFHTGGPTMGQAAKICNNLILFINLASTAEGATLADRLGLDREVFWKIASVSSANSWPLRNWYPIPGVLPNAASSRGFTDPTFTARLAHKDVSLAVKAAQDLGVTLRMGEMVQAMYESLLDSGRGEKDCSVISELM